MNTFVAIELFEGGIAYVRPSDVVRIEPRHVCLAGQLGPVTLDEAGCQVQLESRNALGWPKVLAAKGSTTEVMRKLIA